MSRPTVKSISIFNLSIHALVGFCLTFSLCLVLIIFTIYNRSRVERLTMEQIIMEKSTRINEVISKLLYKTQALSALVIQNDGDILDFERVAATLVDDPAIKNVLLAPGGVVTQVYPLEGNESVIGLDFFQDGTGNKEALMAKECGELVFGGPFELVQGGQALVGRLPVYIDSPDKEDAFWGLVSVTLKFPEALENVGLFLLEKQNFAYEIWRTNPDDNERQIIANSSYAYNKNARYIERSISILNAEWFCRISPVRNWYQYPETWLLTIAALLVSLLVAYVAQNNVDLTKLKSELEVLSRTDSLTDLYNRFYFMEIAEMQHSKAVRQNNSGFIILFDLDNFKQVNDRYGHMAGDVALRTVAQTTKHTLRTYDLLARFGGEEFIMMVTDIEKTDLIPMIERIRRKIEQASVAYEQRFFSVTASFGIAQIKPDESLLETIKRADQFLYQAKDKGRNCIVFGEETTDEC